MVRILKWLGAILVAAVLVLAGFRLAAALRETRSAEELAPANGHFVETSYGKLHYSEWGKPDGRPVVMTHGMAAWGGLWTDVAEALAARGYRVIAVDQSPFGFSDSSHEDFSIEAEGKRVAEIARNLKLEHALLVGHSFGGGVAIEAALQAPDAFEGLVLACPVTKLGKPDARQSSSVPIYLQFTPLTEVLVSATITNPYLTRTLLSKFMFKKDILTDQHIEILQRAMPRQGNTHAMAIWIQQFMTGSPTAKSAGIDAAKAITIPVSLIWGDKDSVVTLDEADRLKTLLKARSLSVIPGVGHMPQLEAPDEFKIRLLEALSTAL